MAAKRWRDGRWEYVASGSPPSSRRPTVDDPAEGPVRAGLTKHEQAMIRDGSAAVVAAFVRGGDPARAQEVWEIESERDKPRKTVADAVRDILGTFPGVSEGI